MTVGAGCALSACSPLPLSIKPLAHWLSLGGGCQPLEGIHLSFTPVASIQNKANLLFHQLAFLLAFEQPTARPHFGSTWCYFLISIQLCSSHLLCASIDKYITFLHVISPQIKLIIFIQLLFKISWDKRRTMHACCFFIIAELPLFVVFNFLYASN